MPWTRITDPEDAERHLPAWLGQRLIGRQGRFGLLLTTGDVLRITTIAAAHLSAEGLVLLDVQLDAAGVPDGVDLAWRSKHFLGMPVPGALAATVNLAQVVTAVEFLAAVPSELSEPPETLTADEVVTSLDRAAEEAAQGRAALSPATPAAATPASEA
ncbi:hypothetical protein [Roseicella frigidaeris]|uniref:Uncharacterized protein n=1 Tax=Roseicella frigidaeris TaxID=2230885 RepID=A0A327MBI3_9PROT|nr:hypothetical protein [Roseicella frigidaeris]RAI60029.1 hypothetical protein DOO78_07275 [Roseicella frigidaeris]